MAEALLSPGVFVQENDASQITQGPLQAGAALLGPTVVGPVNIPTIVRSYSDYQAKFGSLFISGGVNYEYLTSIAAANYFEQGGESLIVTRVASGSYTPAQSTTIPNNVIASAGTPATASASTTSGWITGSLPSYNISATGSNMIVEFAIGDNIYFISPGIYDLVDNAADFISVNVNNGTGSWNVDQWATALVKGVNNPTGDLKNYVTASYTTGSLSFTGSALLSNPANANGYKIYANGFSSWPVTSSALPTKDRLSTVAIFGGASANVNNSTFTLETLSVGDIMNNSANAASASNGVLPSGSSSNIRWEITGADTGSGVFTVLIRRGDDYQNSKTILETWANVSLDPNQSNYIAYVIGDQTQTVLTDEFGNPYLQTTGSYANASRYVRVKEVISPTPNYFTPQGQPVTLYKSYIPTNGSGSLNGSFQSAVGPIHGVYGIAALNMFENIKVSDSTAATPSTNIQGVFASDYDTALGLLKSGEDYDFNIVSMPGVTYQNAADQVNTLLSNVSERGDAIAVVDMVTYGQSLTEVGSNAQSIDNSYGATYWPWIQVRSRETGKLNFVPASTIVPAVYEYSDKVSAEWFAPAGMTRGGLPTVLQPERKLTVSARNTLYGSKVNPIAVFPGQGTVIYGQKTLQSKPSALDRVNVRRLLISLKRYIKQIGNTLVFEQNTAVTRNKFLSQVNPYLDFVQQKQGLYAFRVVMDETNNTPDVIDRNQLIGTIYIQPTRTAEFIQLDFNVLPTGATFGQ
jgi:phage tail sheath protein FI